MANSKFNNVKYTKPIEKMAYKKDPSTKFGHFIWTDKNESIFFINDDIKVIESNDEVNVFKDENFKYKNIKYTKPIEKMAYKKDPSTKLGHFAWNTFNKNNSFVQKEKIHTNDKSLLNNKLNQEINTFKRNFKVNPRYLFPKYINPIEKLVLKKEPSFNLDHFTWNIFEENSSLNNEEYFEIKNNEIEKSEIDKEYVIKRWNDKYSTIKYNKPVEKIAYKNDPLLKLGHFKWDLKVVDAIEETETEEIETEVKENKTEKIEFLIDRKNVIAEIKNLRLGFTSKTSKEYKEVIRGVDLIINRGEVLGILGESGSGKTVITSAMLGILSELAVVKDGEIFLNGIDVSRWGSKQWDKSGFRGPIITSVFQNPMKTLNPVRTIADQFIETIAINNRANNKKEALELSKEYLEITQIKNIEQVLKSYPHELSGGMIQRVVIAMALSTEAQIIVMDEPTTALDPVVQAEIVNLIIDIKEKFNTSFIFITHDIGVIGSVADKVAVMYAGKIVEYGSVDEIVWNPKHPYTWNLLMAMPDLNNGQELFTIPGSVPADSTNATNEVFAPRNNYALDIDFKEESPRYVFSPTHYAFSNLYSPKAPTLNPPKLIKGRWDKFQERKGTK